MGTTDEQTSAEPPPSYSEAIGLPSLSNFPRPQAPQPQPQPPRPSPRPPQAFQSSHNTPRPSAPTSSSLEASSLYNVNNNLPFKYPNGHFCQKCKNSGYKIKNGKICSDCWDKLYLKTNAYNPNPELPFRYPRKYLCEKCNNTGYKMKNGRTCTGCWERFSPRNGIQMAPSLPSNPFSISSLFSGPAVPTGPGPGPGAHLPPMRVSPGDPRIGGTLCGRCRGSGLITFFLDDELCPVCGGIGRILNSQQPPPRPPMPFAGGGHQGPPRPGPPGGQYPPNFNAPYGRWRKN